jgi:hypothetical protein
MVEQQLESVLFVYIAERMRNMEIEGVDTGISKHVMQLNLLPLMPKYCLSGRYCFICRKVYFHEFDLR